MMPTGGDTNMDNQRAVLVANMIEGLIIDFNHIITDEIFIHAHKTASTLPFMYLIM